MRVALAIVAVVSFGATFPFSRLAQSSRCIESVRRLPTTGGNVGEALEKEHGHVEWIYRRGGVSPHLPDYVNVAAIAETGEMYFWSCSDESVPLVLAEDEAARALTPNRVRQ